MARDADAHRRARFERVAAEVWGPLQGYVRRRAATADADDVVADTLLVLWRRLDDIPEGAELPWAYQSARRCLANHRRGDRRRTSLVDRLRGRRAEPPAHATDPSEHLAGGDPALAAAMAQLSIDDRELLHLWAWEQLEPREIAVALGVAANTVSVRLGRARRRLADALAVHEADPACHDGAAAGQGAGVITMEQHP